MFTKNIKDTFTKNLLDAVSGVLGEAKKKCEDCGCTECECESQDETNEGYVSHAQRKAVWANRADDGKGHPDKKKKMKEEAEVEEGYIPTQRNLTARDNETVGKLAALMKKEREAKEKKEPLGVKTEETIEEKRGLWDNIHAKRERIKRGSGERMRKPGSEGAPTAQDFKDSQKESVEVEEAVGDITVKKLSPDEAFKKHTGQMTKKTSVPKDPRTGKTLYQKVTSEGVEQHEDDLPFQGPYRKAGERKDEYGNKVKNVAKHLAKKAMKTNEEVEELDEVSKATLGSYIKKASGHAAGSAAATAAIASSSNPKVPEKVKRDLRNRLTGISKATDKLTKEDQDFIDSLNKEMFEEIDMVEALQSMSDARLKYHATKDFPHGKYSSQEIKAEHKRRMKAVPNYHTVKASLNEARGRPRKAAAKDYTINPRTKEKLMHNNPEHMKKIELLQKNGVLPKPKTEANQNIMTQLQRAKTSMRGGETVHFTHGDSHHVSGTHAAKLLDKHAGMKPAEKEAFQKKIGHSHAKLQSEL